MDKLLQAIKDLKTGIVALVAFNIGGVLYGAPWVILVHGVIAASLMVGATLLHDKLFPRKTPPESK